MCRSTAVAGRIAALALTFGALAAPAAWGAGELPAGPPRTPAALPAAQRLIVEWEPGTTTGDRLAARAGADARFVRTLGAPRFQLVQPQAGQSAADALSTLRDDPAVRSVSRDGYSVLDATTNDPLFGQLWGLQNTGAGVDGFAGAIAGADVGAAAAWDRTRGSASVVIADIDSGYRFDAPDLAAVAWTNPADPPDGVDNDGNGIVDDSHGADFVGSNAQSPTVDGDPTDDNLISGGHGVHTAGTMGAAGNNGVGISGVAQDVRIMPLRVCANDPSVDDGRCPFSSQVEAINYAGAHGARVANMSLGGTTFVQPIRDAIAANPQTLFVISAGNDAQDNDAMPHYPCDYDPSTSGIPGAIDNIVCVAATDQADHLASFSDWGAATVDLGAPGTETLSTYPAFTTVFGDDFEANDFGTKWSTTAGADFGFSRTNAAPLTSFGMSAVTDGTPNRLFSSTSSGAVVPAGSGACTLTQTRTLSVGGGDRFQYVVLSDGSPVFTSNFVSSSGTFSTVPITGLAGTTVRARFNFTAGATPTAGHGAWIDDVKLACYAPLSTPPGYDFLEGTSMAAPHVTGAAGLLFSLEPSASVAEVRGALLGSVDPDPALAGRTTTGGRLDVSAALDRLVPPETAITAAPPLSTTSRSASFSFVRSDAALPATFECRLDGAAFTPCASPQAYLVAFGAHTFDVRAKDVHGNVDATPASFTWHVVHQCRVPKLKGRTLRQARRALRNAHCRLGKVTKPRKRRHHRLPPLVVASSKPRAGRVLAENATVKLTLAPKPKAKRHRTHKR